MLSAILWNSAGSKMSEYCHVCGGKIYISLSSHASVPDMFRFCREQCLHDYITGMQPLSESEIREFEVAVNPEISHGHIYSQKLARYFRSKFELLFAEKVVFSWNQQVYYEHHSIQANYRKHYVPDFWFPEHGVWVELKGVWHSGAKKKFLDVQRNIGRDRLLLLPALCYNWFT
jgi:predicted nuclease of restriction endonuclease-like RecB superfamily